MNLEEIEIPKEKIIKLEYFSNELFLKSLDYLKEKNYLLYLKNLATSRGIDIILEEYYHLKLCNSFFNLAINQKIIDENEREFWFNYGMFKAQFLTNLITSEGRYLEDLIKNNDSE